MHDFRPPKDWTTFGGMAVRTARGDTRTIPAGGALFEVRIEAPFGAF